MPPNLAAAPLRRKGLAVELLIELGCEELPAAGLGELAGHLADGMAAGFKKRGIHHAPCFALWTPRRLCVRISDLPAAQAEQQLERRGPALNAALDASGQPSKALIGFAASCGVSVEQLQKLETDKGSWFVHRAIQAGRATVEVIPEVFAEALAALPIAKPMRWGAHDYAFLRPVHWLVALLDEHVVPMQAFGQASGRLTYGHRFHAPEAISLAHPRDYEAALERAYVRVKPSERAEIVREQVQVLAAEIRGRAEIPAALLDEVTNLTEWPVPIRCAIPQEFMRLPAATIVTTIETHQRYFPIYGDDGRLLPAFVGVANLQSTDPSEICKGYERVVRPRLADADFFYQQDLKTPLAELQKQLGNVTFQAKLGTVWEKSQRVAKLAAHIAPAFGADSAQAERAALLAKCDLMSRMVGEFPELQGEMGKTYALAQGESAELAASLDQVYWPKAAGSAIASTALGRTLAVAERLDTLAGIFAVGLKPTGNKDAFALRRAALGLARTVIESGTSLDLSGALAYAVAQLPASAGAKTELVGELYAFIIERLRAYYIDRGVDAGVIEAVVERKPTDLLDFDARLRACQAFRSMPESVALAAANKRIRNLLRKLDGPAPSTIDPALFELDAERALHQALGSAESDTQTLFAARDYTAALKRLAALGAPVDRYFVDVMVMADDPKVRANRLASLNSLSNLFLNVADVSAFA